MPTQIYAQFLPSAFSKSVNLTSDTLKMGLLSSSYTPNLTTDTHWGDINSDEISGTGYVANGASVGSPTVTLTAANSWGHTWAASVASSYGAIIRPVSGNGFVYRAVVAGTSASVSPTFPTTTGVTVVDGSVTWACLGDAVLIFTSNPAEWFTATFNASYGAIYDSQSGSASTDPLIALLTFGSTQNPSGVNFTVEPDPILGWFAFSPPS